MLVKNFRGGDGKKWKSGVIEQVLGPVTYLVNVNGQTCKKHIDQLIATKSSELCRDTENVEIAEHLNDNTEYEIVPSIELKGEDISDDRINESVNEPPSTRPQRVR